MKKFDEIKKVIAEMDQDVVKLDKGVKAAGPRVPSPTTDLLKAPRFEAK